MAEIKGDTKIFEDMLTIIFKEGDWDLNGSDEVMKAVRVCQVFENGDEPLSFDDIVGVAKDYGYLYGTIKLLAENPLNGKAYCYNNYGKNEWVKIGDLIGYA